MRARWIILLIVVLWILWEAHGFYMEYQYAKTSHYADAIAAYIETEYPRDWVKPTEEIKLFKTGANAIVTSVSPSKTEQDVLILAASIPVRWNYYNNPQKSYKKVLKKKFHARIDGDLIELWDPDREYYGDESHFRTPLGKPRTIKFARPKQEKPGK